MDFSTSTISDSDSSRPKVADPNRSGFTTLLGYTTADSITYVKKIRRASLDEMILFL